jgi:hypothetical protein
MYRRIIGKKRWIAGTRFVVKGAGVIKVEDVFNGNKPSGDTR